MGRCGLCTSSQLTSYSKAMVHTEVRLAILVYLTSIVALTMAPCHVFHHKLIISAIERTFLDPFKTQPLVGLGKGQGNKANIVTEYSFLLEQNIIE